VAYTQNREGFFGRSNALSLGIKSMGLVSFSSLIGNLENSGNPHTGTQALFRTEHPEANLYNAMVSDISHTKIMQNGEVLVSPITIYEDIGKNIVEASEAIQSINGSYHAQDHITYEDIRTGLNELLTSSPESRELADLVTSLAYILQVHGASVNLLPELNKFRSQIPNRANTTPEGKFYESIKKKIYNANQLVLQGRKLKKYIIDNPMVIDLREPLLVTMPYMPRVDALKKRRAEGHDGSATERHGHLAYAQYSAHSDFIPFIYHYGHDIQGQVGLDPGFNPLTSPASHKMPPYFGISETGIAGSTGGYDTIRAMISKLFVEYQGYLLGLDEVAGAGALPGYANFYQYLQLTRGYTEGAALELNDYMKYLKAHFSYMYSAGSAMTDTDFIDFIDKLQAGTYDIDDYRLEDNNATMSANNDIQNNKFTLVENGHFSFDYEKALGLFSNISLALDTQKIDNFFGRELLQSHFKIQEYQVNVNAKLMTKSMLGSAYGCREYYEDGTMYPRTGAHMHASYFPIGSITCAAKEKTAKTDKCIITRPEAYADLNAYRAMIEAHISAGLTDTGITLMDFPDLGGDLDYQIYKNIMLPEIEVGYTLRDDLFPDEDLYDSLTPGGGYTSVYDILSETIPETLTGTSSMLELMFADAKPISSFESAFSAVANYRLGAGMYNESLVNALAYDGSTMIEKACSHITHKNIGGIDRQYWPTRTNYKQMSWQKVAGPMPLISYDEALDPATPAPHLLLPVTDPYGQFIAGPSASLTRDEINKLVGAYWLFNQFSHMPAVWSRYAESDYRLATFEFQKLGNIPESILQLPEINDSFANIVAFRSGVFPGNLTQYINRQFYDFSVKVSDNTAKVYDFLVKEFKNTISLFSKYVLQCQEACVYNSLGNYFNDFFVKGIMAKFETTPEKAPWIIGPLVYCFHLDLLTNRFNGDIDQIKNAAASMAGQLRPDTGTLEAIISFERTMLELFASHYSPSAGLGTPREFMTSYVGPETITFGHYRGPSTRRYAPFTETSAYSKFPGPYMWNGYAAKFESNLQDTFSFDFKYKTGTGGGEGAPSVLYEGEADGYSIDGIDIGYGAPS
jgi:hypothetical protein